MHDNYENVDSAAWLSPEGDWHPVAYHSEFRSYSENFDEGWVRFYHYGRDEYEVGIQAFHPLTVAQSLAIRHISRKFVRVVRWLAEIGTTDYDSRYVGTRNRDHLMSDDKAEFLAFVMDHAEMRG